MIRRTSQSQLGVSRKLIRLRAHSEPSSLFRRCADHRGPLACNCAQRCGATLQRTTGPVRTDAERTAFHAVGRNRQPYALHKVMCGCSGQLAS